MIAKPIIVERSSSPSGSSFPTHLSDLPPEIVEKVFLALPLTDRLKLLLVSYDMASKCGICGADPFPRPVQCYEIFTITRLDCSMISLYRPARISTSRIIHPLCHRPYHLRPHVQPLHHPQNLEPSGPRTLVYPDPLSLPSLSPPTPTRLLPNRLAPRYCPPKRRTSS